MKKSEAPDWILRLDALYDRMMERADRLQDYWRDYAFLGLDEEIRVAGREPRRQLQPPSGPTGFTVKVRQLTLQMFIQLCAVRSPFLTGGTVRPEHVVQILWRLSPEYDLRNRQSAIDNRQSVRSTFVASVAGIPFRASVRAISRYLDRMLIDKPPSSDSADRGTRSDTSFAASVVHAFAKSYGWSDDTTLRMPMPALFQYLRRIQREDDPEAAIFNPLRDKFTHEIFQKYLKRKTGVSPVAQQTVEAAVPAAHAIRVPPQESTSLPKTDLDVTGTNRCKATTETILPSSFRDDPR